VRPAEALLVVVFTAVLAHADDAPFVVRYEEERLTVDIDRVPLDQVMAEFEGVTGIAIRGELRDTHEISKRFDRLPLGEALERLLGQQNFAVRYDAAGRPTVVELYGLAQAGTATRDAQAPQRTLTHVLSGAPAVEVSPMLQEALKTRTVRPSRLLVLSVRNDDAGVRSEARGAVPSASRSASSSRMQRR
jgi:hypothetical protein